MYIRELSYEDELQDAEGVDLMAPVFLAITGEDETWNEHVNDMKRKTKSIEDLCSMSFPTNTRTQGNRLRKRSTSDVTLDRTVKTKEGRRFQSLEKIVDTDCLKISADVMQDRETRKSTSTIKSYASFDDLCISSGAYCADYGEEETFVDPDTFIAHIEDDDEEDLEVYNLDPDVRYPSEEMLDNISFSSCQSWKKLSESDLATTTTGNGGEGGTEPMRTVKRKDTNALKRSPPPAPLNPSTQCDFLEYNERRSPIGSPQKVRCLVSCNTAPTTITAPVHTKDTDINSTGPILDSTVTDVDGPATYIDNSTTNTDKRIIVNIEGAQRIVDMRLIAPYLKVLSHGGHHQVGTECRDIVVFTACFLPSKCCKNYTVVMEQLFFYCVHAVDLIVSDAYEIVFFNSALESDNMPSRKWIRKYYDMIFYKLRKNLKDIFFVHQSLWLKAVLRFSKLFVSNKFREKIHLVRNIDTLKKYVPLDYIFIPQSIHDIDKSHT